MYVINSGENDRLKDQTKENGHCIPIPNQGKKSFN